MADSRTYEIQLVETLRSIGRALGVAGLSSSGSSSSASSSISSNELVVAINGIISRLETNKSYLDILLERLEYDPDKEGFHLKTGLFSDSYVVAAASADFSPGGGGGSIAVYTLPSLESTTFDPASEADTFNAYTIQSLHTRIKALEQSPGGVSSVAGLTGDVAASDLFTALGLGTAATLAVGAIENANTGLVTGGDVYSFVNSSVATATATFRGTNTTATTEADFLAWADALTHDLNDYVFWSTTDAYGNTVYKRYKYDGTQWVFEYNLNNSSFTAAQWAAINSGITYEKINGVGTTPGYDTIVSYFTNGVLGTDNIPELPTSKITGLDTALTNINGDITALQGRATELEKMFVKVSYTVGQETRYYLKLNPAYYDGIAAEGFGVFASSANFTPGGGGGGADLGQVWQSLQNAASPVEFATNLKFHQDHLPATGTGLEYTTNEDGLATGIGIDSGYKLPTTTEWSNKQDKYLFGITGTSGDTYNLNNFLTSVPKATNSVIGGFKTGYTESGKNYAVKMSGDNAYVNVPWTDTVYSLPLAANGTRGGVQIGYSESGKYYAVKLSSEKMYVCVPWENTWRGIQDNLTSSTATTESLSAKQGYLLANGSARDDTKLPLAGGVLTGTLGLLSENIDWNVTRGEGNIRFLYNYDSTTSHAPGQWFSGVSFMTSYTGFQLATFAGSGNDNLYFRQCNDGSTPWSSSWNIIWHSGNFVAGIHYVAPSTLDSYLPLSAGSTKTLTGALFLKGNQYDGYKTGSARTYGIDANNSDIIGVNSILTSDKSDSWAESIGFYRGDTGNVGHYDTFRAANGTFYFGFNGYYDSSNVEHAASESVRILPMEIAFYGTSNFRGYIRLNDTDKYMYVQSLTENVAWRDFIINPSGGNVGIGKTDPGYKLDVSGVINASTGVRSPGYGVFAASASSSDERLKDGIVSISPERAWSVLMQLKPREWTWNANYYQAGKRGAGLVAQEVEPVLPFSVLNEDKYLHLNYNVLHGFEIAGLQDHETRLRNQETMLKQAEKRIAVLEAENAELKARLNN